jgi:membrane-associated phospholipid phosphatase
MIISDILSISTVYLYIIPLILFLYTKDSYHIRAFVGILAALIISICIRHIFIKEVSVRPHGATNCDVMATNGNRAGKPGMPSSHVAVVVFFALFYLPYITNPILRTTLIFYTISIIVSRYDKKCHSVPQIVGGALLGIGIHCIVR